MKIIQVFPGKVWGGAEQYIFDLGTALQESGHELIYLAHNNPAIKNRLQGKIPFKILPVISVLNIHSVNRLSTLLRQTNADVIHIHDVKFVPLIIMAKLLSHSDVKVVLTRHIARASSVNPLFRWAFKKLHNIIFVSELSKTMWVNANLWMPAEKCHVVHNSIPPIEAVEGESLRIKYHISQETPLIVFSGRVRRSKGCAMLIQALGEIRHLPFFLIFIGACKPGNYNMKLLRMAQEYGIQDRVLFEGFSDKARCLIQDADIGVAPSIVREACPLSPMEFMQAGKCVISTNNGAQPEYITSGKTGLLISPYNYKELAEAIELVLLQPQFRKELGENSKLFFEEYLSYEKFINNIHKYYE